MLSPTRHLLAGTMTATKIAAESTDRDPDTNAFRLFHKPIQVGTQTATFVRAESADNDAPIASYKVLNAVHSDER
jgi:hypothetical protein